MKNSDIIKAIYNANTTKELTRDIKIYNNRLNKGVNSFYGIEKYQEIIMLLIRLSNDKYKMTSSDKKLLKQHNILLPDNHQINNSFVAVSDFHSYRYPLEKIKNHYLKEYDVIYILGDATDRGETRDGAGGIKLLIDIMKLSKQYPGRVIYLPGNHDEFLLGYIRSKKHMDSYYPYSYTANLIHNGGEETIYELNNLEKTDPRTFNELISWIGKLPLQRIHQYNGKEYVLGHAIFNQKLYNINPNYSLENYFRESEYSDTRRMATDVLWFRKFENTYNQNEMPNSDKIMVIGHTTEAQNREKNINLTDSKGGTIKVHCVDGGIAYNGGMIKYDGAETVFHTEYLAHNDTSKQHEQTDKKETISNETIFQSHILSKVLTYRKQGIEQVLNGDNPKELSQTECQKIIENSLNSLLTKHKLYAREIYIKTFLFDYILENQIKRMKEQNHSPYTAAEMIDTFLYGNNSREYIARKGNNGKGNYFNITGLNYSRELAKIIGSETMLEVLYMYGCQNAKEYIQKKHLSKDDYSNNQKRR